MKKLLLPLLLLPLFSMAQHKILTTLGGEYYFGSEYGNGYGPHVAGSVAVSPKLNAGLGLSVIYFDGLKMVYPPIAAEISFFPLNYDNLVSPFLFVNPGYSIYKTTTVFDHPATGSAPSQRDIVTTTGGPTLYTGMGVHFPNPTGKSTFISIGYASYTSKSKSVYVKDENSKTNNSKTSFGSFTIRAGIMID